MGLSLLANRKGGWPTEMDSDSEIFYCVAFNPRYSYSVQEKLAVDIFNQRQGVLSTTCDFSQQKNDIRIQNRSFAKATLRFTGDKKRWCRDQNRGVDVFGALFLNHICAEVCSEKHQQSLSSTLPLEPRKLRLPGHALLLQGAPRCCVPKKKMKFLENPTKIVINDVCICFGFKCLDIYVYIHRQNK